MKDIDNKQLKDLLPKINMDADGIQVLKTDEEQTVMAVAIPFAKPWLRGTLFAVLSAILVGAILVPLWYPQYAAGMSLINGVLAFGWFNLFRTSSSASARFANEAAVNRALFEAQIKFMQMYVSELQKNNEGNFSAVDQSKVEPIETEEDNSEPEND